MHSTRPDDDLSSWYREAIVTPQPSNVSTGSARVTTLPARDLVFRPTALEPGDHYPPDGPSDALPIRVVETEEGKRFQLLVFPVGQGIFHARPGDMLCENVTPTVLEVKA